jgi:hypothetical protein
MYLQVHQILQVMLPPVETSQNIRGLCQWECPSAVASITDIFCEILG